MPTILTPREAEHVFNDLSDKEKARIKSDKIRFGEYFIGHDQDHFFRIDPVNIIVFGGRPFYVSPNAITII